MAKRSGDPDRGDVAAWSPARKFPETYPGACPDGHYLLLDDKVRPLSVDGGELRLDGQRLDDLLAGKRLPRLAERYPVLAYGANRNPATLHVKLANYGYATPAGGDCIPVLKGHLTDADVVACGLHGQGYFYGELLLHSPFSVGTTVEVRVCLFDEDQLRVFHDSEGVRNGLYSVAQVPGVVLDGFPRPLAPLGYVTNLHVYSSRRLAGPLAFAQVPATGRRLPALSTPQILAQVLDECDLRGPICAATGLADDEELPHELAKYLNGQWWYQFNTGDRPLAGFSRVLELVGAATSDSSLEVRSRDHLTGLGLVLDGPSAYRPGRERRLGAQLG